MPYNIAVICPCDLAQKLTFYFLVYFVHCRVGFTVLSFHFDFIGINKHDSTGVICKTCTIQTSPHLAFLELKVSDKTSSPCSRIPYRAAYMQGVAIAIKEHEIVREPVIIHPLL